MPTIRPNLRRTMAATFTRSSVLHVDEEKGVCVLIIEEGKFYKRRDGKKSGKIQKDSLLEGPFYDGCWHYYEDGTFRNDGLPDKIDLISEWVDEPVSVSTNKYQRQIKGATIDVYDVLRAFDVTCPATAHAVKKLLMPGLRGNKDALQDLKEARQALDRAIELEEGK